MISNIIYILATTCLFIGSVLTFKYELPDFFYLTGTSLFLLKSACLFENLNKKKQKSIYYDIL